MNIVEKLVNQLYFHGRALLTSGKTMNEIKLLVAKSILAERHKDNTYFESIHDAEFKVFSQFGEDGIIQYLIWKCQIRPEERTFIEFGAETYNEANTKFLMINNNWRGLLMEQSTGNVRKINRMPILWMYNLAVLECLITPSNINSIISSAGFSDNVGLLSIDIDGIDYWVWQAITVTKPVIIVCEYNSVFGSDRAITVPLNENFYRMNAHHSSLFFGCSLRALHILAEKNGYALVGSNSSGNNAFFVRRDRLNGQPALSAKEAYVESQFRESLDEKGNFTFVSGDARAGLIADMMVFDIELGREVRLGDVI